MVSNLKYKKGKSAKEFAVHEVPWQVAPKDEMCCNTESYIDDGIPMVDWMVLTCALHSKLHIDCKRIRLAYREQKHETKHGCDLFIY